MIRHLVSLSLLLGSLLTDIHAVCCLHLLAFQVRLSQA